MTAGINPLVAQEMIRQRQHEVARNAERIRILSQARATETRRPVHTALVATLLVALGAAPVLFAWIAS